MTARTLTPKRGTKVTCAANHDATKKPRIGTTPAELVFREGSLRLLRYRPTTTPIDAPPLLLVMPVINRPYVVDLTPATSFVGALQDAGVDLFVLDWGRPRLGDRNVGLADYAAKKLPRVEAKVLAASGAKELVLAGYCLGGTIAVTRAALAGAKGEKRHAGLVTIHAPVSFGDAGPLGTMTKKENFPVEALLAAFGNMPGEMLQQGFYQFKPMQQVAKWKRLFDRLDAHDRLFPRTEVQEQVEEFIALETWNSDNVPVTGAFYKTLIQDLYQGDKLVKNELEVAGQTVRLAAIECPVLVIVAKDDPICLPHMAAALLEKVSSQVTEATELTGGHVRSLTGPRVRHKVAGRIASWCAARKAPKK